MTFRTWKLIIFAITILGILLCKCMTSANTAATESLNPMQTDNMIVNGDFENGYLNWTCSNPQHAGDPGNAVFSIADEVAVIDISNSGSFTYSIALYQPVFFDKNVAYVVSFEAKSDSSITILANIVNPISWANLSRDNSFELSNTMKSCSFRFTMPEKSHSEYLQFCLGNAGATRIYIDNVVMRRISG